MIERPYYYSKDYDEAFVWMYSFTEEAKKYIECLNISSNYENYPELYNHIKDITKLEIKPLKDERFLITGYAVYPIETPSLNLYFWNKTDEIARKYGFKLSSDGIPFFSYHIDTKNDVVAISSNFYITGVKYSGINLCLFENEVDIINNGYQWTPISTKCIYYASYYDAVGENLSLTININSYDLKYDRIKNYSDALFNYEKMMKELKEYWSSVSLHEVPFSYETFSYESEVKDIY